MLPQRFQMEAVATVRHLLPVVFVSHGIQMLEISLLSEVALRLQGQPLTHFRSQKELALLVYLAHTGRPHSREALADLLWDARSTQQSLSNLRTVLTRLRKQVGDNLVVTRKTVAVKPAVHQQTDSVRLQTMLGSVGADSSPTAVNLAAQALDLYRGEFMAGFYLPEAPRFNDWLESERENVRQIVMGAYRQVAALRQEQGAFAAGVVTAQQWATWDPFGEMPQQQLMRLLAYDGRRAEALAVYEKYRVLLNEELGVDPAPATMKLVESIQDGSLVAPQTAPPALHNLPRALIPLFGRQKEIAALTRYLVDPAYPVVTVTGAGGIGKTSLALAAARRLVAEGEHPFKDGIWFVSLEVVENDTPQKARQDVAALIGQAMGLYFQGESDLWSQLMGHLASKNLLLILDNIEQFLTAATDLIVDLLQAGDGIHLLITSRASLALASSVAFSLTGLDTPSQVSADALDNDSVRLFAERAARMPGPFHLETHLAEVVAICQFVEGMPLGIELAAASLGRLTIEEIMPALTSNLHLVKDMGPDLPQRQRTLQAVFDYSWQILDRQEQTVLAQISVFRGGFTREAATAVLNGSSSALYNLQHHGLLSRDESGRYRMHPLLRQLAAEKLNSPALIESSALALQRHSAYFADFMHSFTADLQRGVGVEAIQTILPERANLRAAWQEAVRAEQWPIIARCLDSIHRFYTRQGLFSEEVLLINAAVSALQAAMVPGDDAAAALLSRLFTARAADYRNTAQFKEGIDTAEQACNLARQLQDQELEARARLASARILSTQHQRAAALLQFEAVVALAQAAQNPFLEADGWIGIGGQLIWQEDDRKTQEALHHALDLCLALQYRSGEMETLRYMGTMASRQEDYAASVAYHKQALALSRLLGDVAAEAHDLGSVGVITESVGDLVSAQSYQREALAIFHRLHMPETEGWMLGQLGYIAIRLGDHTGGEQLLAEALAIATRLEDNFWQGWVKLRLGEMWYERGEAEQGLPLILEAHATAEKFQYLNFRARVLYDWGNALLSQSAWAGAERKYQEAYDLRHGSGRIEQALPALAGLAVAAYRQARLEAAAEHAERLWQYWLETPAWAARADLRLYWHLGMVWKGLEDPRAADLWQRSRVMLHERGEKLPDAAARQMFLEQVPAHRAIAEALRDYEP